MSHDPNLVANVARVVPDWRRVGENVGVGYDVTQLHNAFMGSSGHRANIMGDYNQVGSASPTAPTARSGSRCGS